MVLLGGSLLIKLQSKRSDSIFRNKTRERLGSGIQGAGFLFRLWRWDPTACPLGSLVTAWGLWSIACKVIIRTETLQPASSMTCWNGAPGGASF